MTASTTFECSTDPEQNTRKLIELS